MAQSATTSAGKGWQGAVLALLGGNDYTLTVTETAALTEHYVRIGVTGGGLLAEKRAHPTMWLRLWFEHGGKLHQRGYTVVDPDPTTDTFHVEFAMHDGTAARWARDAAVGDQITATLMGSKFTFPEPEPSGWLVAGDAASLAAINTLLDAISASSQPDVPVTLWFEYQHASDRALPLRVRPVDTVHWISRGSDGADLLDAVRSAARPSPGNFGWVALEAASTRAVASMFRNEFGLNRRSVKAQAYWTEGKSAG